MPEAHQHDTKIRRGTNNVLIGFTLAEVLITLGIIGVVAAMTLPTLITKYQKNQTVNQLKKAYSEINQAIRLAESEHGLIDSWDFADFATSEDRAKYFSENYLFPHIKVIKKCQPVSSECWADNLYNLDGVRVSAGNGDVAFVTPSGYSVFYWLHQVGNGGWFWIDINGPSKRPNTLGRDIFPFIMSWGNAESVGSAVSECTKKMGFLPKGLDCRVSPKREDLINGTGNIDLPKYACKKGIGKSGSGGYCGALIMFDGWQIKDDYPWVN